MIDFLILASAISWLTTVVVLKDGPYKIVKKFKDFIDHKLKDNSPLTCFVCTSFYVGLFVLGLNYLIPELVYFFGIIGLGITLRGLSQEF